MAGLFEQACQLLSGIVMIFDQQHLKGAGSNGCTRGLPRLLNGRRGRIDGGEPNRDFGTFAYAFTFRADRATMQFDDRATDGESQAEASEKPAARSFTLLEGIENSRHRVRPDADAGVADFNDEFGIIAVRFVVNTNGDASIVRGKFAGVLKQVPKHLR